MHALIQLIAVDDTADLLADDTLTGSDWIRASSILAGSIVIAVVVSRVLRRVIAHGIGSGFASIVMARLASYIVFLVGLFYALTALGVRVGPLIGALGLGGLVIALAMQRFVENFVSSIILQARRPFTIGDTVELDGHTGVVVDIDSRVTILQALDGTQVRVPNASVVSSTIVNLTREPIRRSTVEVGVAYDSDLQRAHEVLVGALSRVPRVLAEPPPVVNVTGFDDSSIGFSIFFWHRSDVPSELAARTDVSIAVHQALDDAGITIAFPQVVVWTGTSGARPYETLADTIDTPYPALEGKEPPHKRGIGFRLRRGRSGNDRDDSPG